MEAMKILLETKIKACERGWPNVLGYFMCLESFLRFFCNLGSYTLALERKL